MGMQPHGQPAQEPTGPGAAAPAEPKMQLAAWHTVWHSQPLGTAELKRVWGTDRWRSGRGLGSASAGRASVGASLAATPSPSRPCCATCTCWTRPSRQTRGCWRATFAGELACQALGGVGGEVVGCGTAGRRSDVAKSYT